MTAWKFPPIEPPRSTRRRRSRAAGHYDGPDLGVGSGGFYGKDTQRLISGWTVEASAIDYYLLNELRSLRARARELCRQNEYAKNFQRAMRRNIVGPKGVHVQPQVIRGNREPDKMACDALAMAWMEWGEGRHCDISGRLTWLELQNMLIYTAAQDGEFLIRKHPGTGEYGYTLEVIDPARLDDRTKWGEISNHGGNEIRLGVEYDQAQKPAAYWIRDREAHRLHTYDAGRVVRVPAEQIIHGFLNEYPDQSRGIPWLHSALVTGKRLDMYESAAMSAAQAGAMAAFALVNKDGLPGDDMYIGDELAEPGNDHSDSLMTLESGDIVDFGDKSVVPLDPSYPHEMYKPFIKSNLQRFAAGVGLSYATLSSDLEGVNYSSIRAGVLDDREEFMGLQSWFINRVVLPVYKDFAMYAIMAGKVLIAGQVPTRPIGNYQAARGQGRRWSWVDPQKDMTAAQAGVDMATRSRSSIIRESGGEPEQVFGEIAAEQEKMKELGIQLNAGKPDQNTLDNDKSE